MIGLTIKTNTKIRPVRESVQDIHASEIDKKEHADGCRKNNA